MNTLEKRRMEELVDAVIVGMAAGNEDDLFEAFINRPHGRLNICGEDFENQNLARRDEIESALENYLNDTGKGMLSEHTEVVEQYWSTVARCYFDLGVRLGRVQERQREVKRMLADHEQRTNRSRP